MKKIENLEPVIDNLEPVIDNWEAVIDNGGDEQIAIPLPGCIIKGEIEGVDIKILTKDVDISNSVIEGIDGQKFRLSEACREYLVKIAKCIEYAKRERDGEVR